MMRNRLFRNVLMVACLLAAAAPGQTPEKFDVKVLDYAGLGRLVNDFKGKVVLVDFWSTT